MRSNFELSIVQIDGGAEREASHVPTQTLLSPSALKCGPKKRGSLPAAVGSGLRRAREVGATAGRDLYMTISHCGGGGSSAAASSDTGYNTTMGSREHGSVRVRRCRRGKCMHVWFTSEPSLPLRISLVALAIV